MPSWRRPSALLLGAIAMGTGVSLLLASKIGMLPIDVLHLGAAHAMGATVGGGVIAVQSVLLMGCLVLRVRPGLGTVVAFVVPALIIDVLRPQEWHVEVIALQVTLFTVGGVLFCLGVAAYLAADLGRVPRDALMLAWLRGATPTGRGQQIAWVRVAIDIVCATAGTLLLGAHFAVTSGALGPGTAILTLGCGPLIAAFWPRIARLVESPHARHPAGESGHAELTGRRSPQERAQTIVSRDD
ncbi:YitT family protein [Amycolatopsis azurea]|uniref:YczE/YyaS/YitT family protein n=1 Tax=Amycolatopsis azurea TaxID=36819 RepID=UPI0037F32412